MVLTFPSAALAFVKGEYNPSAQSSEVIPVCKAFVFLCEPAKPLALSTLSITDVILQMLGTLPFLHCDQTT